MDCLSLNQWGLLSNILGTLLIFYFGLPSKIQRTDGDERITEKPSGDLQKIKISNRNIRIGANIGVSLIFIGFVLQFIYELRK